jgi:hypothetical protein
MKMGWVVVGKEHLDNYAIESRNFRHVLVLCGDWEIDL